LAWQPVEKLTGTVSGAVAVRSKSMSKDTVNASRRIGVDESAWLNLSETTES
jgi:hypothetical protein